MGRSVALKGAPILVVEDDAFQGLDLALSLEEAGAIVIGPVSDVNDAILVAREGNCLAAIMDFRLGTRDAIELGEELHRHHTPFIIHTAYDCAGRLPAQWHGCKLISKPADIPGLIRTIAALLRWKAINQTRHARLRPGPQVT